MASWPLHLELQWLNVLLTETNKKKFKSCIGELKEPEQFSTLLWTNEAIKVGPPARIGGTMFFLPKTKATWLIDSRAQVGP